MQMHPGGGLEVPDMYRPPPRPEMPFPGPLGPDTGQSEDEPEITDKGDPTARKRPHNPSPDITDDFVPDLGETVIRKPEPDVGRKKPKPVEQPTEERKAPLPRLH